MQQHRSSTHTVCSSSRSSSSNGRRRRGGRVQCRPPWVPRRRHRRRGVRPGGAVPPPGWVDLPPEEPPWVGGRLLAGDRLGMGRRLRADPRCHRIRLSFRHIPFSSSRICPRTQRQNRFLPSLPRCFFPFPLFFFACCFDPDVLFMLGAASCSASAQTRADACVHLSMLNVPCTPTRARVCQRERERELERERD
jgi:hypothetical protein